MSGKKKKITRNPSPRKENKWKRAVGHWRKENSKGKYFRFSFV